MLKRATAIAMTWLTISLLAVVVIAMAGVSCIPNLRGGEAEKIFILMVNKYCNPWIGGIFLAAIMAAIMSTIDSQLLVSSSALVEDIYRHLIRRNASMRESMVASRISIVLITTIAVSIAVSPNSGTVFSIVKFAWGGFGATFGPVVIMALYSRRTTWVSAISGMVTGATVMITWYAVGLNKYMYEIVPGFVANLVVMLLINLVMPQRDEEILGEFDESSRR